MFCSPVHTTGNTPPNRITVNKLFIVFEHDQGTKDECDTFTTRAAARHYIEDLKQDQQFNPQWYQHLADPWYSIEERIDRSEPVFQIVEI